VVEDGDQLIISVWSQQHQQQLKEEENVVPTATGCLFRL